jgi:hypothetical protein
MVFELQSILDLRRDAETAAQRDLAAAAAGVQREEEEQARLTARWQAACATLERETTRLAAGPSPSTAAQGLAREAYLTRLRGEATRLKKAADEHRATALAQASASHARALSTYQQAVREREAVSNLEDRARAAAVRDRDRKAEDAANDLGNASRRR